MFSSRVRGRTNLRGIPPVKKASGVINFASFFTPGTVLQSVQSDLGLTYGTTMLAGGTSNSVVATLSGTPVGKFVPVLIKCTTSGTIGSVFRCAVSYDGGSTFAQSGLNPTANTPFPLSGLGQGLSFTLASGSTVSTDNTWKATVAGLADQSGNAKHYTQATAAKQPVVAVGLNGVPGLLFDGVDDVLACGTLTLPAPATTPTYVLAVWNIITPQTNNQVFGDNASAAIVSIIKDTGNAMRNQSGAVGAIVAFNPGTWARSYSQFTGSASDVLKIGGLSATGQAGNNTASGRALGGSNAGFFCSMNLLSCVYLNAQPTGAQLAAYDAAVTAKYGPVPVYGDPLSIFGAANVLQWVRADKGITTATGVSGWADQSGNAKDYGQATGAWQPAYNAADTTLNGLPTIVFDGTDDSMQAALNLPQSTAGTPTCLLYVAKLANDSFKIIASQPAAASGNHCVAYAIGPTALTSLNPNTINVARTPGAWARARHDFSNQASDKLQWGSTVVTGNAGSQAAVTGRSLGAFSNSSSAMPMSLFEIVYLSAIPTVAQMQAYDAYVTALTNGAAAT